MENPKVERQECKDKDIEDNPRKNSARHRVLPFPIANCSADPPGVDISGHELRFALLA